MLPLQQNSYDSSSLPLASEASEICERRIMSNLQLVKTVVRRIAENLPPSIVSDDLMQIGYIGLIDAARRFEGDDDGMFKAYATYRIRGQIMDELRKFDILTRSSRDRVDQLKSVVHKLQNELMRDPTPEEIAAHMGVDLDEYFSLLQEARVDALVSIEELVGKVGGVKGTLIESLGSRLNDPESEVHFEELKNIITREISCLSEKERTVISLYYYDELTLKEIGAVLGVTESRVSQLHSQSILRLERALKRALGVRTSPRSIL